MLSSVKFHQNHKSVPQGTRNYFKNGMKNIMKNDMKMKDTKKKKTGLCVTRSPNRDQFNALSTYGLQLLDNSQPDYAVAYLRTLRRLFNEMYEHDEEVEVEVEEEEEELEEEEEVEVDDRSECMAGNIPSLWMEFGNILESVIQERSMELYNAELDV